VGHGYSVPKHWRAQFLDAYREVAPAPPESSHAAASKPAAGGARGAGSIDDLPLIEIEPAGTPQDLLAVLLTGDGGWAGLDKEVSEILGQRGVTTVGWNSLRYYWTARTPDSAAADLARILDHYLAGKPATKVMLIGYSRGADVLSFLAARLPEELRARVALVALIGPATSVAFELHVTDFLGGSPDGALPILPEAQKLRGMNLLCLQGDNEKDSLCPLLSKEHAHVEVLKGGHHFDRDYEGVARKILAAAEQR